ncbi:hypothetical protein N7470_002970 [Penicillium chermesinum]|nr:hypothetical protein N7470_002970 [Penicillium chermesinum]
MAAGSHLLKLPNEFHPIQILQQVAALLQNDQDLINLAATCKEAKSRVLSFEGLTWRSRFRAKYDLPLEGRTSRELIKERKAKEKALWLEVIQTMLTEALALPLRGGNSTSKNYARIREVMANVEFLNQPKTKKPSEVFHAIQIVGDIEYMTALAFDSTITIPCLRTDYDIATAYSYNDGDMVPLVRNGSFDFAALLDLRSFWQRHILTREEATFYDSFSRLPRRLKPKMFKADPKAEGLSVSWMGYYSCIHPMPDTLTGLQQRQTCADLDSHWDQVDILTLKITSQSDEPFWPDECNVIIPQEEGAHREYFSGVQSTYGYKSAENPLFGFTEPITAAYGGFHGWTRICFAICEQVDGDERGTGEHNSARWVHGYEAIVIPGGRMMLGRWVDMKEPTGSGRGPFVFWDV